MNCSSHRRRQRETQVLRDLQLANENSTELRCENGQISSSHRSTPLAPISLFLRGRGRGRYSLTPGNGLPLEGGLEVLGLSVPKSLSFLIESTLPKGLGLYVRKNLSSVPLEEEDR